MMKHIFLAMLIVNLILPAFSQAKMTDDKGFIRNGRLEQYDRTHQGKQVDKHYRFYLENGFDEDEWEAKKRQREEVARVKPAPRKQSAVEVEEPKEKPYKINYVPMTKEQLEAELAKDDERSFRDWVEVQNKQAAARQEWANSEAGQRQQRKDYIFGFTGTFILVLAVICSIWWCKKHEKQNTPKNRQSEKETHQSISDNVKQQKVRPGGISKQDLAINRLQQLKLDRLQLNREIVNAYDAKYEKERLARLKAEEEAERNAVIQQELDENRREEQDAIRRYKNNSLKSADKNQDPTKRYVNVKFSMRGKRYTYKCCNKKLKIGDYVRVMAKDEEKTVKIVKIFYSNSEKYAGYKRVLRRALPDEIEDYNYQFEYEDVPDYYKDEQENATTKVYKDADGNGHLSSMSERIKLMDILTHSYRKPEPLVIREMDLVYRKYSFPDNIIRGVDEELYLEDPEHPRKEGYDRGMDPDLYSDFELLFSPDCFWYPFNAYYDE